MPSSRASPAIGSFHRLPPGRVFPRSGCRTCCRRGWRTRISLPGMCGQGRPRGGISSARVMLSFVPAGTATPPRWSTNASGRRRSYSFPVLILRAKPVVVLPEFLAWAVNQPPSQRHFDRVARGTNMRMVLRPGIEDLKIEVPQLEVQRRIVAVDRLVRRERELAVRAADIREQLITRTRSCTFRPCRLDPLSQLRDDLIRDGRDPLRQPTKGGAVPRLRRRPRGEGRVHGTARPGTRRGQH